MASSQPYDPYIPQDSTTSNLRNESNYSNSGNDTTAALKAKIDDTVDIMRENINKVVERGERLDSIEDRADNLATSAQGFKRGANRVRKQMWWKDTKWTICLIIAVIILLIVIIVPIVVHFT